MICAFEVSLNGERLCLAGIDGDGVLNAMVGHVKGKARDELDLKVGGLVSATGDHVRWTWTRLKMGDEVHVKVVDADSVDQPAAVYRLDSEQEQENRKAYVRAMVQKLGWTLLEAPGSAPPQEPERT